LVLRTLTNHIIARQVVEEQQACHICKFKEKIPHRTEGYADNTADGDTAWHRAKILEFHIRINREYTHYGSNHPEIDLVIREHRQ
jgi:hypothetical protein